MGNKNICYLFGAGEHYCHPPYFNDRDFIVAVDGGFDYLKKHNVSPNLIIGDFDSLLSPPTDCSNTIILPQEKDDTDMVAALHMAWECGNRTFYIYGGTGCRFDHTLANIQCIANITHKGGRGYLFDKTTVITAIKDDAVHFPETATGTVSVFPHSDVSIGVTESGLKFPLNNATLRNTYPLGISNEFAGNKSSISVNDGTLIIIYQDNIKEV